MAIGLVRQFSVVGADSVVSGEETLHASWRGSLVSGVLRINDVAGMNAPWKG